MTLVGRPIHVGMPSMTALLHKNNELWTHTVDVLGTSPRVSKVRMLLSFKRPPWPLGEGAAFREHARASGNPAGTEQYSAEPARGKTPRAMRAEDRSGQIVSARRPDSGARRVRR